MKKPPKFIAIDSEGGSFGYPKEIDGQYYQPHKSFLWGAGDIEGDADWLFDGCPLGTETICDWLKMIAQKHRRAIFISFAFSYDVGQLLADLPYETAWEIQRGKPINPEDKNEVQHGRRTTFWRDWGFQYLKGKQFTLSFMRDGPRYIDKGKRRVLNSSGSIRIYDVFGFFQASFLKAIGSMPGVCSADEYQIIEKGKSDRGSFDIADIRTIKEYTRHELTVLCRMMEKLRGALEKENVSIKSWFGAGSIAQALLRRERTNRHFYTVKSYDLSEFQQWAHHAYFGGRIELIKQGATTDRLYGYDIASAYPAAATTLPSMEDGEWIKVEKPTLRDIRSASPVSMFHVKAKFPPNRPFYPLPYRTPQGSILFPMATNGIYMQSEAEIALEYASDGLSTLNFETAWIYRPSKLERPFAFLQSLFDYRASLSKEDITQIVIKLGINSVYGKLAQAIGQAGKPPAFASPWHAAAITAWTRAQLLRAAMNDPDAIVMLATDGIISTRPLQIRIPRAKTLGAWEAAELPEGGVFCQSGVYAISGEKGWTAKSRGFRPTNVEGSMADYLRQNIPAAWKVDAPAFAFPYIKYMTLGASIASRETWPHIGKWVEGDRELDLRTAGVKRDIPDSSVWRKARAGRLMDTRPNCHSELLCDERGEMLLSAPSRPDWLDENFGLERDDENEQENVFAGF